MSKKSRRGLTRRQFGKLAAASALAASGPAFLFPSKARAAGKTLKIIQWSHFVPGYDKWFDGVYTKEWGSKHDTEVIVDHVAIGEINARAAAEAAARALISPIATWSTITSVSCRRRQIGRAHV